MKMQVENFLRRLQILNGSHLKLIAVISMLIDHTANAFLRNCNIALLSFGNTTLTLYEAMRYFGRIAFPLYAFLIVEGFLHTSSRKNYGRNLLIFAFISEIPWNLLHTGTIFCKTQNVFFTLFFGFLGLCAIENFSGLKKAVALIGLLFVAFFFGADYGVSGLAFIVLLYLLRSEKAAQAVIGCAVLSSKWVAALAFIPINMYNGKRGFIKGKVAKYAFYAIYPLHMFIFYLIKLCF